MKKFLLIILLCIFSLIPVYATGDIEIESIKVIKSSDGVVLNDQNNVNAIFNDLNQQVKYETTIENKTSKKLYVNYIDVENSSEEFLEYKLDTKSENKVLEPNSSSKITFYINTLEVEGAGRNLDDEITINFKVSDKIFNPNTFTNIFDLIILLLILGFVTYFAKKNKKVKTIILVIGVSIVGIEFVYANNYINVPLSGKVKYESQNNIISSGTTLNNKQADYTNAKEVWAYYDKVKNVEVKSLIKEPKDYYKKFDLTENKTGRVMAYLVENNDKETPYDLKIMSKGVVIANKDSSFMFSFPKTEKVEGLKNIDFSETTTMQGMFIGNEKLKKVEVEAIELSNTVDTSYMFYDCEEIEHNKKEFNIDEEKVNTENMFIQYLYNEVKYGAKVETDENFTKSPSETNLRGNFIRKDTLEDKYPIYYYRGNITDNNVKFAGFCWQIVRTTETGGIKLVYNGTPNENGTCKEPGVDSSIASSAYNTRKATPSNVGYMYGSQYLTKYTLMIHNKEIDDSISMSNNKSAYYYSKKVEYKDGKYYLIDPVAKVWSESFEQLKDHYTCRSTTLDGCTKVFYISGTYSYAQYAYPYTNGETLETDVFVLGKSYTKESDGTYTLKDIDTYTKAYWYDNNKDIVSEGYYACSDMKSKKCNKIYKLFNSITWMYYLSPKSDLVFGNDVEYINGEYVLKDTITAEYWHENFEKITEKYHYTCNNSTGKCNNVYYMLDFSNSYYMTYITLSNGKKYVDAYNEIFEPITDSAIKQSIDNWYGNKLINYTAQLEDTVWCNDRKLIDGALMGENVNSKKNNKFAPADRIWSKDNFNIELKCTQQNDKFTVSKDNGNGALKYPIGLLTADEVKLSGYTSKPYTDGGESYLISQGNTNKFYTMSPVDMQMTGDTRIFVYSDRNISSQYSYNGSGVRPAISLKQGIKYTTGDGTKEKPYVIEKIEQ